MQIAITQEDVDLGTRRDSWNCPLARALWRATGRKYSVTSYYCRPVGSSDLKGVGLPLAVREFARQFDSRTLPAKLTFPIVYDIEL